jgi:hypothetical protein
MRPPGVVRTNVWRELGAFEGRVQSAKRGLLGHRSVVAAVAGLLPCVGQGVVLEGGLGVSPRRVLPREHPLVASNAKSAETFGYQWVSCAR